MKRLIIFLLAIGLWPIFSAAAQSPSHTSVNPPLPSCSPGDSPQPQWGWSCANSADVLAWFKSYFIAAGALLSDGSNALPSFLTNIGAANTSLSNASLPAAWDKIKQSNYARSISVEPSPLGNWNSVSTACTGNLSGTTLATCFSIIGTALPDPVTGYLYVEEAYPQPGYLFNSSGANHDTGDNGGRTAAVYSRHHIYQHGQGDIVDVNCSGFGDSTLAGSTSFLANPAVVCSNGAITSGVAGLYMQLLGDYNANDKGFDDAAVLLSSNLTRTVGTGAKNAIWLGWSEQSKGTVPVDSGGRLTGPHRFGIDLTGITFPDVTLESIVQGSGGISYSVNDILTASGGTCDQPLVVQVLSAPGGVIGATQGTDWSIVTSGMCSSPPTGTVSFTGGTGSGATFTTTWNASSQNPVLVTPPNSCWYSNAINDSGVYQTGYPSTELLHTTYLCYRSGLVQWVFGVNNTLSLQIGSTAASVPGTFSRTVDISTGSAPTLTTGSCSGSSWTGGATAGKFTAPSCAGGTLILSGLPTAPNGYTCIAQDQTTTTDTLKQTANGTTNCTLTSTTANNDVIVVSATAW